MYADRHYLDVVVRLVRLVDSDIFDLMDHFVARSRAAEDAINNNARLSTVPLNIMCEHCLRMLVVQPRSRHSRDEELRSIGLRASICHRQHVRPIMLDVLTELVFEILFPNGLSASSITERIARLDHEFLDDTMEEDTFKVCRPGMSHKVLNCFWSNVGVEL